MQLSKRYNYISLQLGKKTPSKKELFPLIRECIKLTKGFKKKVKISASIVANGVVFWEKENKMSISAEKYLWDAEIYIKNKKSRIKLSSYELEYYLESKILDEAPKYDKLITKFLNKCGKVAKKYRIRKNDLVNYIMESTKQVNLYK